MSDVQLSMPQELHEWRIADSAWQHRNILARTCVQFLRSTRGKLHRHLPVYYVQCAHHMWFYRQSARNSKQHRKQPKSKLLSRPGYKQSKLGSKQSRTGCKQQQSKLG